MFIHFSGLVVGYHLSHNEISVGCYTNGPLPASSMVVLVLDCAFVITVGPVLAGLSSKLRHQNVEGGWVKEIAHQCLVGSFDLVSRLWVEQK